MTDFDKLYLRASCAAIMRDVFDDCGVSALVELLRLPPREKAVRLWADYYRALSEACCEDCSTRYFEQLIYRSDNVFSRRTAANKESGSLEKRVKEELETLRRLSEIAPSDFSDQYGAIMEFLPQWKAGRSRAVTLPLLKASVLTRSYGVFSQSIAYGYEDGALYALENVSGVRLGDLKLYEDGKRAVCDNTLGFLEGLPANNVLLYGDRGTGKSSTVHAVLNEYAPRGLRLIQLGKKDITHLSKVFSLIGGIKCLRFIVFIDDLSFVEGADDYAALKAALEGSVSKPDNAVIYATTNRRHLIKESHEERNADVHPSDAVQEQISLSDRFGLVVTFPSPDKRDFIDILSGILADRGVDVDKSDLVLLGERYALKKGGRSGRAAKQLADAIESRVRRGLDLNGLF